MSAETIKAEEIVFVEEKPNSYKCRSKRVPEIGFFYISKGVDENGCDYLIDTDIDFKSPGSEGYIEISYWLAERIGL